MINIFRNKRKKLAEQNRSLTYIRYAFGEIVLVVVGILIALQINNWNETQKNQKFEKEILNLINQNLERDSVLLSNELFKAKKAISITDRLIKQVALKNYKDSLSLWMGKIISFERFKSQSSAFEVLKARGIESVSNSKLQLLLISYYDENTFGVYQSLNDVEKSFKTDWIPLLKNDFSDYKWLNYAQPTNSKRFFEKPSSIVLFKIFKDNRAGSVRQMNDALNKISEIRKIIKNKQ